MRYAQRHAFESDQDLFVNKSEDQWFDRKSARVSPEGVANLMIGFANADGGTILVGVEDDGTITGVRRTPERQNQIRNASLDFTEPWVRFDCFLLACRNELGEEDDVLLIEIPPSSIVHRNHRREVFRR